MSAYARTIRDAFDGQCVVCMQKPCRCAEVLGVEPEAGPQCEHVDRESGLRCVRRAGHTGVHVL